MGDLKLRLGEVADLGGAMAVLGWDQATYMPRGGAVTRGRQLATLGRLAHERLIDPAVGRLLDQLEGAVAGRDADDNDAALVRVARRDFERARRVPSDLVGEIVHHGNQAYAMWTVARPANDFDAALPIIENGVRLARTFSSCFKPAAHVLDPLIAGSDPGLKTTDVSALFDQLKSHLVPLVKRASAKAPADDACLKQHFPEAKQLAFGLRIAERVGYDLVRGRIDVSPHPFSTTFGHGDVRITTQDQGK